MNESEKLMINITLVFLSQISDVLAEADTASVARAAN